MKARSFKLLVKIFIAVAAVLLLILAFIPEPIPVDMHSVRKGLLQVTLEGEGKTRIHDIYVVSTPVDGRVTRIESEPGDLVKASQTVIANLHPANPRFLDKRAEIQAKADVEGAKAALALARTRVKQSRAQLVYDREDFKRIQELYNKQSVSKVELDQAELRLITLEAELETARSQEKVMEAQLHSAQARLLQPGEALDERKDDCEICVYAPVDGQVLRILHKSEGIVPAGTPLVEIGNPGDLEASIEMLSTNAVQIEAGDDAFITRWGGEKDLAARVRLVEPSGYTKVSALGVEEQRVNVILDFIDPNGEWKNLGDAYRVEAEIVIDTRSNVLLAPVSALFRENEQWSVFKVVSGVVQLQAIDVGLQNDRYFEVKVGLSEGDQIIVHPGNNLRAGVKVIDRQSL